MVFPRLFRIATVSALLNATLLVNLTYCECAEPKGPPPGPLKLSYEETQLLLPRRWESLLPQAGKPQEGLILETHLEGRSAVARPISITLSIKNVSGDEIALYDLDSITPQVLVRDQNGSPAMRTKEPIPWKPLGGFAGPGHSIHIRPGGAFGRVFPLSTYFVFDKPGTYTVLAGLSARFWNPTEIEVAKPLKILVVAAEEPGENKESKAQLTAPARRIASDEPADSEWTARTPKAGIPVGGFILEAIDSPLAAGKGELVVSLRCVLGCDRSQSETWVVDPAVADFRVLVRDLDGRPVAANHDSPTRGRLKGGKEEERHPMGAGDAAGAIIPLRQYFDLATSGEYWVLVWLPKVNGRIPIENADWVAEPIKVRVGPQSLVPKK
jgi:hypothetical protein